MDGMHAATRISTTGKPWIDCPKCNGTGLVSGISKAGRTFTDRPCFRCSGTGDGNIVAEYKGPRGNWGRGGTRSGYSAGNAGSEQVETSADTEDESEEEHDTESDDVAEAARRLAEAIAARRNRQPVDAETVRRIAREEIAQATLPGRLDIFIAGEKAGELPAVRHPAVEDLLIYVQQGIPVYIVGPAGSGKTTGAEQVAKALGLTFYLMSGASGAHELTGYMDAHGRYQTVAWRQAYEHGGLILWDEVDTSEPGALTAANAGIANGHMNFPDRTEPVKRHSDFRLVAAANTFGSGADRQYVARTQLDAATLDRFAFIEWSYCQTLERHAASNDDWTRYVQRVRSAVDALKLRHVVSPRASIMGAKLLSAGMARDKVETSLIWKGMSAEDVSRVKGRMA